jgi:glycosyltransferase involved in cell wall biosynthesis
LFSHFAHAHATDTEPIDVLFFGRILPYKGLDVLLQADPLIRNHLPDYRLAIVGEGNLAPYRSLIPSGPCVKIVNRFVSRGEASRFLRSAKVVVLPYIDASQSGVAAAALGVGTPVVVTAVGSLPEIIQDGRTGLVVPPNDPAALAEAISSLLTDEALRKRVGKGIKESAVNLSWDVVAKRTTQVYEAVKCESHS